jgi:hypothetical protein
MNPKDVTETPRAESAISIYGIHDGDGSYHPMELVEPQFARTLERELSEATKERDHLRQLNAALAVGRSAFEKERDQWKAMAVQFSEASNVVLWDKALTRFREMTTPTGD